MGEVVNVLVAFAVIIFLFRWVTSDSTSPTERSAAETLGFRPKPITQDMIDTISHMFPDIPVDNIRYDLLRTGSVELTSNKILERGFLDAPPPAYFAVYPPNNTTSSTPSQNTPSTAAAAAAKTKATQQKDSLLKRYGLEQRAAVEEVDPEEVGGKAVWEDSPEKREASLRERKAKMILAARQRLLAQEKEKQVSSSSS